MPQQDPPEAALAPPADATPRLRAPLVPPPAETWDGAAESRAFMATQAKPAAADGAHDLRPLGIALGLFGIVGVAAAMAVLLGASRRPVSQMPVSILRHAPADSRRRRGAR